MCIVLLESGINFTVLEKGNKISDGATIRCSSNYQIKEDLADKTWHTIHLFSMNKACFLVYVRVHGWLHYNYAWRCNHSNKTVPHQRRKCYQEHYDNCELKLQSQWQKCSLLPTSGSFNSWKMWMWYGNLISHKAQWVVVRDVYVEPVFVTLSDCWKR